MKGFKRPESKKIINIVHILDSSGSMRGEKYEAGKQGLIQELESLSVSEEANYTYTVVEFANSMVTHVYKESDSDIVKSRVAEIKNMNGGTALFDTVGYTLNRLKDDIVLGQAVIVSIVTDGEENASRKYSGAAIKKLIAEVEEERGWVVTFVGTERDVNMAVRMMGIKASNTNVHDNTGKGFEKMSNERTRGIVSYAASYSSGVDLKDLSKDFYPGK